MNSYKNYFNNFIRYILIKQKKKNDIKNIVNIFFAKLLFFSFALIFLIFFILLKEKNFLSKKQKMKICLCSIGKEENLYVKEFVSHYKKIGYNKIFIYDNNDINGERFEFVLQNEVNEGFISLFNYRGYKNYQLRAYYDCYKNNNYKYNWLSFFDMDELLEFYPPNLKAQEFFGKDRFNKCINIKINWVFYYSNSDVLYYEDKPFQERFKNFKENRHIKSTVRGNLSYNYWSKALNPHTSLNSFTACSCSGKIINFKSPFNEPPDIKYAYLKHYHKKSFEEYCMKVKRGKPSYFPKYKIILDLYKKNKNNKEKLEIFKKIFGNI
jgi:hypothetical protein